jgi:hypothetical protein
MKGRAYRRHQWQRAKRRAVHYLHWVLSFDPRWITSRRIARYAVDRTRCSCHMCCNPRHFTGEVTRQELMSGCRAEEQDAA